ncbi:MAG: hypothetical protein FWE05_06870 [Defluviitaleaceae bacterium]|nr:hypothetical protein [Defluviitaleaceae bacterium]
MSIDYSNKHSYNVSEESREEERSAFACTNCTSNGNCPNNPSQPSNKPCQMNNSAFRPAPRKRLSIR